MPSLVSTEEVQALVQSDLAPDQIQQVIDREETELIKRFGTHSLTDSGDPQRVTEELQGGLRDVYVDRLISIVASVTVSTDSFATITVLDSTEYRTFKDEGRLSRIVGGVPISWERDVRVTYNPQDNDDVRKSILIELVRIALERQAFLKEGVAGEYSYTAPGSWEAVRESLYSRLKDFIINV